MNKLFTILAIIAVASAITIPLRKREVSKEAFVAHSEVLRLGAAAGTEVPISNYLLA